MTINEAIKKVKDYSKEGFDASVEAHIHLQLDPKKPEHNLRFTLSLPNGTGKTKKVAVLASKKIADADLELTESDLEKIEKGTIKPKTDFDILITEPKFMPKIAKVARILGPLGMMPNPKTGTVSEDVEKAVSEVKKGRMEVKTEKSAPLIHTLLGKVSFDENKLVENYNSLLKEIMINKPSKLKGDYIKSIHLCSSMGPAFKVDTLSENK